jgi:hypothetical protein
VSKREVTSETAKIKDAVRKLTRSEKVEIYRWIDEEAADDLLLRIGEPRNRIAREIRALDSLGEAGGCPSG